MDIFFINTQNEFFKHPFKIDNDLIYLQFNINDVYYQYLNYCFFKSIQIFNQENKDYFDIYKTRNNFSIILNYLDKDKYLSFYVNENIILYYDVFENTNYPILNFPIKLLEYEFNKTSQQ